MENMQSGALQRIAAFKARMAASIIGQEQLIEDILIAYIAGGHVLLEGAPGLAKTLTVRTFAELSQLSFKRIQFTPDLLPADLTGTLIFDPTAHRFSVRRGPLFAHVVLADEINRAPAKVQSALLEAMAEGQITIGENSYRLPRPFFVLATQNPIEQEGTYQLPEAQVDRFMMKVLIDYPQKKEEMQIIRQNIGGRSAEIRPVITTEEILEARQVIRQVYLDEKIEQYIVDIVFATRYPEQFGLNALKDMISFGASPRASINLQRHRRHGPS